MFQLRCTVRNCEGLLAENEQGMSCPAGHHFDRAKQGYWNLLQPQDRRSKNPGDAESAVLARHRWLQRGFAAGLIEALRQWVSHSNVADGSTRTVDLGCGEGSFGPALFADQADSYCGIDLSKRAIKLAARGWPQARWVLANADRILPATDESVHRVISLFGRRPISEIYRVLVPGGTCIVAVPGEDDLIELREQAQQAGHRRSRWETIVDEMTSAGVQFVQHQRWTEQHRLDREAIADALAMTYRAVRHSQQARIEGLQDTTTTLSADLLLFRKPNVER